MPSPGVSAILFSAGFYPDATLALDFMASKYRSGAGRSFTPDFSTVPNLTVTRSSVGYAETSTGTLVQFASNVARITDKGLLVEEARTNLFLNSFAPVTQNVTITAASHTITVWGTGSVTVAAGTATISNAGAASAGSPRTIGCTVGGTISVTVTGLPTAVNVEAGSFGTSPIPTLGVTATRAADNISLAGFSMPSAGTAIASFLSSPLTVSARVLGSAVGAQTLIYQDASVGAATYNGSATLTKAATVTPAGTRVRAGMAWTASSRLMTANGAAPASDANSPGLVATLVLGSDAGASQFLSNYIERVFVYPTNYSAAQLQAATT